MEKFIKFYLVVILPLILLTFIQFNINKYYQENKNIHFQEVYITDTINTTDTIYFHEDIKLLARLIESEASIEPLEGKIAVGNVVKNRAFRSGKSIKHEIYKKSQFNGTETKHFYRKPSKESFQAAYLSLTEDVVPTHTYYFMNEAIATNQKFKDKMFKLRNRQICNHTFYYE